jgi:hypothetical protein
MSHFSVLVIGPNVDKQLQPYHEFECTGIDDEYVQEIDETEKYLEKYNTDTRTMYEDYVGNYHSPYDDKFYREPTKEELDKYDMTGFGCSGDGLSWSSKDWKDGKGYRPKVHFIPKGYVKKEIPFNKLYNFKDFLTKWHDFPILQDLTQKTEKHKYQYVLVDKDEVIKVIDRTNPNSKWDWYEKGGRWAGYFKLKENTSGIVGTTSLLSPKRVNEDEADILLKGDIDLERMKNEASKKASIEWDFVNDIFESVDEPFISWNHYLDRVEIEKDYDIKQAREDYKSQLSIIPFREVASKEGSPVSAFFTSLDEFTCPREEYIQKAINSCITPFAFVKEGKWYEKGEMGWWACVSNKKDSNEWNNEFMKMFEALPDDTMITAVDCHV